MQDLLFKICEKQLWEQAKTEGVFSGTFEDKRDGYIHLSTADQVVGTLSRYYVGQKNLVLIALNFQIIKDKVTFEKSASGMLFPHLYGSFKMDVMMWERDLVLNTEGKHDLSWWQEKCAE